ncbi:unnamed protein product [Protopolystoma xenopodis]|uniref:Uncharacterized protein n=1 Tax=Protopolystoma xenopodis TaxID=117903 RepID=A0A3S5B5A9_9PLAT|nr:unnamed protein product [Protopolystoma xenopodis]
MASGNGVLGLSDQLSVLFPCPACRQLGSLSSSCTPPRLSRLRRGRCCHPSSSSCPFCNVLPQPNFVGECVHAQSVIVHMTVFTPRFEAAADTKTDGREKRMCGGLAHRGWGRDMSDPSSSMISAQPSPAQPSPRPGMGCARVDSGLEEDVEWVVGRADGALELIHRQTGHK